MSAQARAIFSLEGQGEVRPAKVPELPIKARWITLKNTPIEYQNGDGTVGRKYDQDGWIWQAEEVRKGDRWERSYGFVGHHVIARVPASEIELSDGRFTYNTWGRLPAGLDARVEPVEAPTAGYEPGRPILMALRIRNRRGVEHAAPTEFLRRGAGGPPALRPRRRARGLLFSPESLSDSRALARSRRRTEAEADGPLRPGATDASRPLAPFEVFEAMRLDLNEWFDLTKPGGYHVRVKFTADSGVGEGASNDWYFTIGDRDGSVP